MAASAGSAVVARLEYLMRGEENKKLFREVLADVAKLSEAYNSLTSKPVLEKDVTQLAYDIEDSIESYVRVREAVAGKPCGSIWKLFLSERRLQHDLCVLRKKINDVKVRMRGHLDSPDKRLEVGAAELVTEKSNHMSSKITSSANNLVGLAGDVERLSSLLRQGEDRLSVMAIVGMGGIGKTTLARSLFDHPSVEKHFSLRIWARAGVNFQARGILEYILRDVYPDWSREEIEDMESMELLEGIYEALGGKRYLVVLDGIWSKDDWETIRFAFPDNHEGSRVIVTSRCQDVAHRSTNYTHQMRPLTNDEGWELMQTRLGHQDLDTEAQRIGRQIIEHCRGVPLLISVVGSQFRFRALEDWEKLLRHLVEDLKYDQNKIKHFIDFSYKMLPVHLKPCFLYLGHFPTDHEIQIEKLYLLWIAEGFISTKDVPNSSEFDMAENHLMALVNRSMVIIQEEQVPLGTRRSKSCRIHDLIRDLSLQKGMEEEFFRVFDLGRGKSERLVSHRLAIYLNMDKSADGVSVDIPEPRRVRSLLFFETNGPLTKLSSQWPIQVADLKEFRRARVLDFDGVDFRIKQLPKNIRRLVYLRYLSFRDCYLLEFPSSFSNLSFLETLDLLVRASCRMTIPNVLRNFKRLRYLYLPVAFQLQRKAQDHDNKLKLNGLTQLEILENFHAGLCDANDLEKLDNVQRFTGVVDGNTDDLEKILERFMQQNKEITSSTQLSLVVKNFDCYSKERFLMVQNLLTHCEALSVLELEGHLPRLPSHKEISTNFTEMVFSGSEFEQDPMQILGKLPKLRSLVLSNNAFAGDKMVCYESGFPELTILKLEMLQRLKNWEVNSGAMPNLALLTIHKCKVLEKLPATLMKITTLKELKIGSMPPKFEQNARRMAAEVQLRVTLYS